MTCGTNFNLAAQVSLEQSNSAPWPRAGTPSTRSGYSKPIQPGFEYLQGGDVPLSIPLIFIQLHFLTLYILDAKEP